MVNVSRLSNIFMLSVLSSTLGAYYYMSNHDDSLVEWTKQTLLVGLHLMCCMFVFSFAKEFGATIITHEARENSDIEMTGYRMV